MSDSNGEVKRTKRAAKSDALANVLSKILAEDTGRKAVPVLAKRKTEAMRMIEDEHEKNAAIRQARQLRKEEQHKQQKLPHEYDIERERTLRKIATKGVVALFNAITSAKKAREESGVPLPVSRQQEKLNRRTAGQLRKKQAEQDKAAGLTAQSTAAAGTAASSSAGSARAGAGAAPAAASGSGWAVLSDDIGGSHKLAASLYHTAGNTNSSATAMALKNAGKRNKIEGGSGGGAVKKLKGKHWDEDDGDDDY